LRVFRMKSLGKNKNSDQLKADLMLLLVTLGWGVSYYLMDISLEEIQPFSLSMYRFGLAFIITFLLSGKRMRKISRETLKYSLFIGTALFFVYTGATFGVKYTTMSNAAFLCAMTVVFVPILELIFYGKVPSRKMTVAFIFCFMGILLLTLKDDFSINMENLRGDILSLLCAVSYAGDLLITDRAVSNKNTDAFQIGVLQLGVTAVFMGFGAFIFEKPTLPETGRVAGSVIFLSIFCTGLAFIIQVVAQKHTTPSHVGIIFSLEPVFAGIVAYFLGGEILSFKSYIGMILIMISLVVAELPLDKLSSDRK
jgi:drug/metabolite transporter (DMT)-like permease